MKKTILNRYLRYNFYRKSEKWSKEKIEKYQDEKLIKLINHAYENIPYYRDLFKKINFNPKSFRGRIDMHKIPLLDKDAVRTRRDEFIADNANNFGVNYDSTSGSTGTPLQLVIDNSTEINKLAALMRCYKWAGYKLFKKTFSLQSYLKLNLPKDSGLVYKPLFNVYRFDSNHLNKETALKCAKELNRVKPKFYMGYPLPLLMLNKFAAEEKIPLHSPESMVTFGETLSDYKKELLEESYKTKVFDFYSLHECSAMISNCKCGNKHWIEDFAYNEVVDNQGKIIDEGTGELIGTSLYNYAMPLIRYKMRDTVVLENKKQKCDCGINFRIIKEIKGRQNDFIETPDGRVLGNVMEHAMDKAKGVILSQCVQDSKDYIYINLVIDKSYNNNVNIEIENGIRKRVGNEIKIEFKIVTELEKNKGGKTPFILSKIGHQYI